MMTKTIVLNLHHKEYTKSWSTTYITWFYTYILQIVIFKFGRNGKVDKIWFGSYNAHFEYANLGDPRTYMSDTSRKINNNSCKFIGHNCSHSCITFSSQNLSTMALENCSNCSIYAKTYAFKLQMINFLEKTYEISPLQGFSEKPIKVQNTSNQHGFPNIFPKDIIRDSR